jgi:hypothetical protein
MSLHAAFARICITPPLIIPNGMWVAQRHVRSEGVDADLYVRALALADGELKVIVLDFDVCFLPDQISEAIRNTVSSATGLASTNILPFASHSHAGPTVLNDYRGEGEDQIREYIGKLPAWACEAATTALSAMTPVRTASGTGQCDIGVNRDLQLEDGRFVVGCNEHGFVDPEVGVIRIDSTDNKPLACIVNFACHPTVLGPENRLVSPDYPGHMRNLVEDETGAGCIFLQGAAGNIGPKETFVGDAAVARRLGALLGLEAARIFLTLKTRPTKTMLRGIIASGALLADYAEVPIEQPEAELRFASTRVELPVRAHFPEVYEKAPERLANWEAKLEELQRARAPREEIAEAIQYITRERLRTGRIRYYSGRKSLSLESCAIRIGDACIVTIAGEPYCEIGAEVKSRSPFPNKTFVAGYMPADLMYIPTAEAFNHLSPPMEVDNSPYAPAAARIVIEHMLGLLQAMEDQIPGARESQFSNP